MSFPGKRMRGGVDEAHYRAAYEADAANRAKQSWSEYWGWVKRFYEGQSFPPVAGWRKREADLARQHAARPDVAQAVRRVGQTLAAEWAKDNSVRKVSTSDLQSWGKRLGDASRDPEALLAALKAVEDEVRARGAKA
jgi:hypothetical protein